MIIHQVTTNGISAPISSYTFTIQPQLQIRLFQNYPNPFNPSTSIKYTIPSSGNVTLEIFDVTGKILYSDNMGYQSAGTHKFDFNGSNFASGIYFYELKYSEGNQQPVTFRETKKMILTK